MSTIFDRIDQFFESEVVPFFENFFKTAGADLIAALTPIATTVVSQLADELVQSAGNPTAFANAAGKTLQAVAQQAEAAGIQATGAALLQVTQQAIAGLQPQVSKTVAVTATPAP